MTLTTIAVCLLSTTAALSTPTLDEPKPIDRYRLVARHNVVLTQFDAERPLSVGNGEFAFNMDVTGLQTFAPFNTLSNWGWHSGALPAGTKLEDYQETLVETHGRKVPYPLPDAAHPELSYWMASSPHRINLGRVGLLITKRDGTPTTEANITNSLQKLDLWRGIVTSEFNIEGEHVLVATACHPELDAITVLIDSPLVTQGRLAVFLACPGNNPLGFANFVGDWRSPGRFEPLGEPGQFRADFRRQMDEHVSYVTLTWEGNASIRKPPETFPLLQIVQAQYGAQDRWLDVTEKVIAGVRDGCAVIAVGNTLGEDPAPGVRKSLRVKYKVGESQREAAEIEGLDLVIDAAPSRDYVTLSPKGDSTRFEFMCTFLAKPIQARLPGLEPSLQATIDHWEKYWKSGGAIDLSESTDPRWMELERRIVLSQYLMGVHEAGTLPPQESGLVNNGWFGRFHMEMMWWHSAHWALWNRWPELNRSIGIYRTLMPGAKALAERQGYKGARWPKCIGPDGREWPHEIHSFLIWQQPHPIFFAELDYRSHPTPETLARWKDVVEATADFMATYAYEDREKGRYVLGPPIHLASENSPPYTTQNPTFELGYWRFGLRVAQEWRVRMGLARNEKWDDVLRRLSPLPIQDGLYVLHEDVKDMWTAWNFEHPALAAPLGMLPGDGVEPLKMKRTLRKVVETWNFERTWGWDFPMLAMTAARVGEPSLAVDMLLHPAAGFQFDARGLATGGPFPYFPSNGGLLYAAAMMAAGWDEAPDRPAPGFPDDGTWKVRYENLSKAP